MNEEQLKQIEEKGANDIEIPIFDNNIFFNSSNNNLIGLNSPLKLSKMANTTNFSNDIKDIKLFKEPLQYKLNVNSKIEDKANFQKNEQNNKNKANTIINNFENENNIIEDKKNSLDIFPNFPSFFNDSIEHINKNKANKNLAYVNNNEISIYNNGISLFALNKNNPIKDLYYLNDPFFLNNNNYIYVNDFRQTYTKMLLPGLNHFSFFSSIKNNFFNSDFSNFPSNQNKNKDINEDNKIIDNKNSK